MGTVTERPVSLWRNVAWLPFAIFIISELLGDFSDFVGGEARQFRHTEVAQRLLGLELKFVPRGDLAERSEGLRVGQATRHGAGGGSTHFGIGRVGSPSVGLRGC